MAAYPTAAGSSSVRSARSATTTWKMIRMDASRLSRRSRFRGALLGLAAGDALGTTVEFRPPGTFAPLTEIVGGGPFGLPAGAWTDDTSMALCLADSLIAQGGTCDPVDQLRRYVAWWRTGHRSSVGRCFDIGGATRSALERFERTGEPFPGDAAPRAGGNAPLMRLAPAVLASASLEPQLVLQRAAETARTTHGMREAIDATRYLAAIIWGALQGVDRATLLLRPPFEPVSATWLHEPLCDAVAEVANGSYLRREPPKIRGTGFAPQTLEAALWALSRHDDFRGTVLAAANLGDDADTTAAVAGQIAGAIHGELGIPTEWRRVVFESDHIVALADELHEIADRIALGGDERARTRPTPLRERRGRTTVPPLGELGAMLTTEPVVIVYRDGDRLLTVARGGERTIVSVIAHALPDADVRALHARGLSGAEPSWAKSYGGDHADADALSLALDVARHDWGLRVAPRLRADGVPDPSADWAEILWPFFMSFNGYTHFGERWPAELERLSRLGVDEHHGVEDVRGLLFLLARRDRFVDGADTILVGDGDGTVHARENPDVEATPDRRKRRALVARIRELLQADESAQTRTPSKEDSDRWHV